MDLSAVNILENEEDTSYVIYYRCLLLTMGIPILEETDSHREIT